MTAFSTFANRAAALIAAMGMTAFLVVASFSAPSAQIVSGMVARTRSATTTVEFLPRGFASTRATAS